MKQSDDLLILQKEFIKYIAEKQKFPVSTPVFLFFPLNKNL